MTAGREPALRLAYRFALSSGEPVFEIATLRRPGLVLRATHGRNIAVDERLLTGAFPLAREPSRRVALVLLAGRVEAESVGAVGPGEALLLDDAALGRIRSKDAWHLNLEWEPREAGAAEPPRRLEAPPMARAREIAGALVDRGSDQRATFAHAFELFRAIGAPCAFTVESFEGEPSDRERAFARALEAQLENLTSHTSLGVQMGESMGLSERQINRLWTHFASRYWINAHSWRDLRNRWRVQNAALLLSRPELTVADVAREVGYASSNALARAFATTGFPPPAVIRQRMSEMDPLP
jgi:AraC-like DNA-binding protein